MTEQPHNSEVKQVDALVGAISTRIWADFERRKAIVGNITDIEITSISAPLAEGRLTVAKDFVIRAIENPDDTEELSVGLLTFIGTEGGRDEAMQLEELQALPEKEREVLISAIGEIAATLDKPLNGTYLGNIIALVEVAKVMAAEKGKSVADIFVEDDLYCELVRSHVPSEQFIRKRVDSLKSLDIEFAKEASLNAVMMSMDVGDYSEADKARQRKVANSPVFEGLFAIIFSRHISTQIQVLLSEVRQYYGEEVAIDTEPSLKQEFCIEHL